jgi:signal transduction histidine kinase
MEYRRQTKSGAWIWIRSVGRIVEYDAAGKALRMYGMHADITARKELELQLLHSQRLETVGTLAGGVAHDLNNILTPMLMASSILRETLTKPADRELIAMIDGNGKRGAAIVKQLVAFSRSMALERRSLDPRQLLQEMAQLMSASLPKSITVLAPSGGDVGQVQVDQTQLQQVLMNLCVNARDAMPAGGTLTLQATREELSASGPSRNGDIRGGPFVVLTVVDTGSGISPEIIDRIFDPFFTTKAPGKGSGLGLASAHGIIKAHGGFIWVESKAGQGTTFRIYLPAVAARQG